MAAPSRSLLDGGVGGAGPVSPVTPAGEDGRSFIVVLDVAVGVAIDGGTAGELEVFFAGKQSAKRSIGGPAEGRGRSLQVSRSTSSVPARVNRGPVLLSVLMSLWPRGRGGRGGRGRLVRAVASPVLRFPFPTGTGGLFDLVFVRGAPKLQLLRTGSDAVFSWPARG